MTTTAEEIKMNFDEVMYQLKLTDANMYDMVIVRKGLHERFKRRVDKVETWYASTYILKTIKIFK
tara:strand:+ start:40 stop:234 length:195 start_codon:yes stop_codon:yes gene_type:complete